MARMNRIPLKINDWLADTECLSDRAQGLYMRLLCHYYRRGAPLPYQPDNIRGPVMRELKKLSSYDNMRSLVTVLGELLDHGKFRVVDVGDGLKMLVNDRADQELSLNEQRRKAIEEASRRAGKLPPQDPVETAPAAPKFGPEQPQNPYQPHIGSISTSYGAETTSDIEQNQQVSGASILINNNISSGAVGQVSGPVLVSSNPEPSGLSAADARAAKLLRMMRGQAVEPPAQGTPEYEAWELRQRVNAVTARIRAAVEAAGVDSPTAHYDPGVIECWISDGADVERHIYPAVQVVVEYCQRAGKQIGGVKYFAKKVEEMVRASRAQSSTAPASSPDSGSRSGFTKGPKPASSGDPRFKVFSSTLQQARQNGWMDVHDTMRALMAAGDEESLRKLNDLDGKYRFRVCHPRDQWEAEHKAEVA